MLLGACLALGTAADAANSLATLSFSGAALQSGGTLSGSITYQYDTLTNKLTSVDSALVTTTQGTTPNPFPAFTWAFNVPGKATNVTQLDFQDASDGGSHQVGLFDSVTTFDGLYGAFVPFSGVGTDAKLITGNSSFGSFFYCQGQACGASAANTSLLSAGTSVGVLGTGAVPEPASWMMLIAGFGIVGAARRRQRLAAAAA
ncbi:MAG: PEPxxWA-CTERM sorting domain-containing protein [Polymorphobacter sp.]